jgi:integrase/recombinase XerD
MNQCGRGNKSSIRTRNSRLGAIHVFARFLAAERPEHLGTLQRYLIRKYVAAANLKAPTLRKKRIHPHSLRTTGVALLKAGIDFATISQLLGHAQLDTTMRYARADIDLKRQAISQEFPESLAPPRAGHLRVTGAELIPWLRRL